MNKFMLVILLCGIILGCQEGTSPPLVRFGKADVIRVVGVNGEVWYGKKRGITTSKPTEQDFAEMKKIAEKYSSPQELCEYVHSHFTNGDEKKQDDTWQEWWETLRTNSGDCEDLQRFTQEILRLQGVRSECVIIVMQIDRIQTMHALNIWLKKDGKGYRAHCLDNIAGYVRSQICSDTSSAFDDVILTYAHTLRRKGSPQNPDPVLWNKGIWNLRKDNLVFAMNYGEGRFMKIPLQNIVN